MPGASELEALAVSRGRPDCCCGLTQGLRFLHAGLDPIPYLLTEVHFSEGDRLRA